jgi:AcrR family transcriptional regulator
VPRRIDEEQVFDAVLQLWVAQGYAGTTTKEVAERAGVNEATLFRKYGSKGALIVEAIGRRLRSVPLRELSATNDVHADLVAVVEAYQQTHRQVGPVIPLLLVEAPRHPELRPALNVAFENIGGVVGIVAHHQASGALRPEDPMATIAALLGPLFVAGMFAAVRPGASPVDAEAHVRGFLEGRG